MNGARFARIDELDFFCELVWKGEAEIYSKNLDYKDVQQDSKAGLLVIYEKLFFWYGFGCI